MENQPMSCSCDNYKCYSNKFMIDSKKQYNAQGSLIDWVSVPAIENCKFNEERWGLGDRLRNLFKGLATNII